MPKITVHEPEKEAVKFRVLLDRDEIRIGSLSTNHICLSSSKVSSNHCKLVRTEFGYRLVDLDSTYGTLFNGEKVEELEINKNKAFYIANVFIQVEFDDEERSQLKNLIPVVESQAKEIEYEKGTAPPPAGPPPAGRSLNSDTIRVNRTFLNRVSKNPAIATPPPPLQEVKPVPVVSEKKAEPPVQETSRVEKQINKPKNEIWYDDDIIEIEDPIHEGFLLNFERDIQKSEIGTKFGGFPDWLKSPTWPIHSEDGKQFRFIAQFKIDPELFPRSKAKLAYFFLRDRENFAFLHECVIVLQPGPKPDDETVKENHGPHLQRMMPRKGYKTKLFPEDFRQCPELIPITDEHLEFALETGEPLNKVGGIPEFVNSKNYPDNEQDWQLLFQLNRNTLPCELGIADNGVCYGFLNPDGTECRVIVQRR